MNVVLRLMEAAVLSLCGDGRVGWWGLHSHFHVQPNYNVEVVLRCVVRIIQLQEDLASFLQKKNFLTLLLACFETRI